jgi:phosphohistidine swiveling domain-containing protein
MTVEKFQSIRFQARTSETIKRANEIIAEYDGFASSPASCSRRLGLPARLLDL